MTTIKATCPTCSEVELTEHDVRLNVCSYAQFSHWAFNCPKCHDEVSKHADDDMISLLMSGGVRAQVWHVPAEVLEPKIGPRLTRDDLLDFALALAQEDLLARQASLPMPRS